MPSHLGAGPQAEGVPGFRIPLNFAANNFICFDFASKSPPWLQPPQTRSVPPMQIDPWEGIKLLCLCLGASTPSEDPCATIISGKPGHGPKPSFAALKALFAFEFQDFSKVKISLQFIRFFHHQGVGLETPQTTPCPSVPLKHSTTSCPWGIAWVSVTVMLWEKKDCSFLQSLAQHLLGSKQEMKCPVFLIYTFKIQSSCLHRHSGHH